MYPDIRPPQNKVDWLIADFAKKEKPGVADFARLRVIGGLYDRLDSYRVAGEAMSRGELLAESHKSDRLGRYLTRAGDARPSKRCDAHAIISGGHPEAIVLRGIMAWVKMRIDDPHNGCWLPRDWDDRAYMPNHLRKAVPHRRIHTNAYYEWLSSRIRPQLIRTSEQLIHALRFARVMLQSGSVPPNVMPRTGR